MILATRTFRVLAVITALALSVAGCGKKGALEPPSAQTTVTEAGGESGKVASGAAKPKEEHKPHILDGLLR